MNLGDRHEIDGVMHECVSIGVYGPDGNYDVQEGRIPTEGQEGVLIAPESDPERAYWMEPVEEVDKRNRVAALEMEMDGLMPNVRNMLLRYEEAEQPVPVHIAAGIARAACAAGYYFGITEEPRGELAQRFEQEEDE